MIKRSLITIGIVSLGFFLSPSNVFAQEECTGETGTDLTSCQTCVNGNNVWTELGCITPTQEGVVAAVMRIFIGVVTAVAVLRFIQAGLMYNTDDVEQIKEARGIAVNAIVAIIFAAAVPIILNFIGVKIINIGQIFN